MTTLHRDETEFTGTVKKPHAPHLPAALRVRKQPDETDVTSAVDSAMVDAGHSRVRIDVDFKDMERNRSYNILIDGIGLWTTVYLEP